MNMQQHQPQLQHQNQYHQYHHLQNQFDLSDSDLGLSLKFDMNNPMTWTTAARVPPASASFSTDPTSLQHGECSPASGRSTPRGIDVFGSFPTNHSAASFVSTAAGSQFNLTPPPSAAMMSAGFGFFPAAGPEPHHSHQQGHANPHSHFPPGPPTPAVLPLTPTRTLEDHYNLSKAEHSPLQELGFEHLNSTDPGSAAAAATAVIDPRQWTSSGHSSLASSPFHLDTSTPAHSSLLPESSNSSISSGCGGGTGGVGSDDCCWDMTAVSAVDNSSPISLNGVALSQFEPASHGLSSAAISRRLHFDEAQHKTAILQQAQQVMHQQQQQVKQAQQAQKQQKPQQQRSANGSKKTGKWKIKTEDDLSDHGSDESPDGEPEPFPSSARGKFRCEYPSCTKAYKRNEHLKRHKFIQHCEAPVILDCRFCDRTFNRADNLRAHIKLHSERRGRARVDYYPEAENVLAEERRLMKGRGRSLSKKLSRSKRQQEQQQHQQQQAASHPQAAQQQQFQLLPLQSAQQQNLVPALWQGNTLLGPGWEMGQ